MSDRVWTLPPNWSSPVNETRAWLSDVMTSQTGAVMVRALRSAPRRTLGYSVLVGDAERQNAGAMLFGAGVQAFRLPLWPYGQTLAADLPAGSVAIPCDAGAAFGFADAGAALIWQGPNAWELLTDIVVGIAGTDDGLTLAAPGTQAAWRAGSRIYPVRWARLADTPAISANNASVASVDVVLRIDEPEAPDDAWPDDGVIYRGMPVMTWRGDESQTGTASYQRQTGTVDAGAGPVYVYDIGHVPFRHQDQAIKAYGLAEHVRLDRILGYLRGRAGSVWLPSWADDAELIAPVPSGADTLHVRSGAVAEPAINRRDIYIERYAAAPIIRRVTAVSIDAFGDQVWTLDTPLDEALAPAAIRQMCWLTHCALASDTVQIQHETDVHGLATCNLAWEAISDDV